jgi:hypothetical protein
MEIAIVKDNQVIEIGHYKKLFPATSFPSTGPDADFMESNDALGVTIWKLHDKATQKLISVAPYIEDNQVFTVEVADKTEEDIAADTVIEANSVRATRDQLLKDTDWTQVADVPVDKPAYVIYRQALRDITLQEGFPFNVEWPALYPAEEVPAE